MIVRSNDALTYRPLRTRIPTAPGQLHLSSGPMMRMSILFAIDGFVYVSLVSVIMNVLVGAFIKLIFVKQLWRRRSVDHFIIGTFHLRLIKLGGCIFGIQVIAIDR